jgi:hypothetical protein
MEEVRQALLDKLREEWKILVGDYPVYFKFTVENYSPRYQGKRRQFTVWIESTKLEEIPVAKLGEFCRKFNCDSYIVRY